MLTVAFRGVPDGRDEQRGIIGMHSVSSGQQLMNRKSDISSRLFPSGWSAGWVQWCYRLVRSLLRLRGTARWRCGILDLSGKVAPHAG